MNPGDKVKHRVSNYSSGSRSSEKYERYRETVYNGEVISTTKGSAMVRFVKDGKPFIKRCLLTALIKVE